MTQPFGPPVGFPLGPPLDPDAVHLWYTLSDDIAAAAAIDAYIGLLSPDERARHDRFLNERARHEYLITRALCRTVLSRYAGMAPTGWRFRANAWGRPEIDAPADTGVADLRFNLSNTRGLVACAVTRGGEIGVDVEAIDRAGDLLEIADRFMAPLEAVDIASLPADAQASRFFTYWTLKEAYIKARGMGLSIPLDKFWFLRDGGDAGSSARLVLAPDMDDTAAGWSFAQLQPTDRHLLAVARRNPAAATPGFDLKVQRIVPPACRL
ncbi:4'-phosphopantetheinyl transferase [Skermanella aerolata]|uniref:4'-phosphopantetheinyl transferase family protein n=1 Tax=Skermanella aerolata TaxID=393310 RepID=UPI003D210782